MAEDTPTTIAILGAGPMGIEAGLYARYLGYEVTIYERDEVAAHVLRWGHVPLFSPFCQLRSSLGIAALRAQDPDYRAPAPDAQLTGRQWVDKYIFPLSQTDLVADHLVCGATALGVTRLGRLQTEGDEGQPTGEGGFHIQLALSDGSESTARADVVIDATGVYGQPDGCGPGGVPAHGEQPLRSRIAYHVPDLAGTERAKYESRRVLVIGSGLGAAATIVALAELIDQVNQTQVTWVTRVVECGSQTGPIDLSHFDGLPQQRRLAEAANHLTQAGNPHLVHRPGVTVESFEFNEADEEFHVWLGANSAPEAFDCVVANVGYRGDVRLYEALEVRTDSRTGGPLGIGEHLARRRGEHLLDAAGQYAAWTATTEPHFYVLGAKSYGHDPSFLMTAGYEQIRDAFSVIGDRAGLDLYATLADD